MNTLYFHVNLYFLATYNLMDGITDGPMNIVFHRNNLKKTDMAKLQIYSKYILI